MGGRRDFIEEQVRALGPLDLVAFVAPGGDGVVFVEVTRDEEGPGFRVEIGGEPALPDPAVEGLGALGFTPGPPRPSRTRTDAAEVADDVEAALSGPLGIESGRRLDVRNGSRREQVERERKLAHLRERVHEVLKKILDHDALERDDDGDFTFPFQSTRVWVAPRALPAGPLVVRVLAVTNVDIEPSPALGLFLSQTNFGLAFGRFSLDPVRHAVWFEETLMGDYFADEELQFLVQLVASTADQFDDRIAAVFGGRVFNAPGPGAVPERPPEKPGAGGYL